MKKLLSLILASAFLFSMVPAHADNYESVPEFTAVWDTTTGNLYGFAPAGKNNVTTMASPALANAWSVAQTFPNGTSIGTLAPAACGATCSLAAANSGQVTLLDQASGSVATLPAATGTGSKYTLILSTTVTSLASKVLAASTSDSLQGLAFTEDGATVTGYTSAIATGNHSVALNGSTTGGFQGDQCVFTDILLHVWQVRCDTKSTGTAATPFSTSAS